MGRKNKGSGAKDGPARPPKLPSVEMESPEESDRLFMEEVERLSGPNAKVPVKDRLPGGADAPSRAAPASAKTAGPTRIDLHRCTVAEARARVDGVLSGLLANLRGQVTVQIITGKGRHSGPAGAVLARDIHRYVQSRYASYIVSIETSPADLVVGELPIRGHFHVTFGKR